MHGSFVVGVFKHLGICEKGANAGAVSCWLLQEERTVDNTCEDHLFVIVIDNDEAKDRRTQGMFVMQKYPTKIVACYLINELQSCSGCSDEDNTFVRSC